MSYLGKPRWRFEIEMFNESSASTLADIEKKANHVRNLLDNVHADRVDALWRFVDLSSIYHDWALEGQVILQDELSGAFDNRAITDTTALPLFTAIRSHKQALVLSREMVSKRKLVVDVDMFRQFHAFFASDPESAKLGRYRKEIPLHRSYFHEICHPSKIPARMRKLLSWMNNGDSSPKLHPIKWASEFHFQFMRIFPFVETTGKIGRTMMNMFLQRQGYFPAIIHATERQRYYETIRQSQSDFNALLIESELSSLEAAEKFLRSRSAAAV
jgi:Fic family protein